MSAPDGYTVDHNRIPLGKGAAVFARAAEAIRRWKMFDLGWLELYWPDIPIEPGATVAVLVQHYGFWSLNASRIVYVVSEPDRYGFAYGTLLEHGESGEERFTVEFRAEDQSVWYDIYAFSRPRAMARIAYPLARRLQKQFARDSKNAMRRVAGGGC